jgi:hypothetical protein
LVVGDLYYCARRCGAGWQPNATSFFQGMLGGRLLYWIEQNSVDLFYKNGMLCLTMIKQASAQTTEPAHVFTIFPVG